MAASVGLAAIGAARYTSGLTESGTIPAWLPYIFGSAVDLLKDTMLAAGFGWIGVRARPVLSLVCLALGAVALLVSLTVQHSSLSYSLQQIEREAAHKSETRSDLRAELREVEDRMAAIKADKTPRPATAIAWDIKTVVIPAGARRNSEDCTTPGDAYTRKACAPLMELRKELVDAEELERLEPRAAKLRKQLGDAQIVASRDPASTSFELLIGALLANAGVKEIDGTTGFPGLMILLLEMVSASGLYIIAEMYGALWPAVNTRRTERRDPPQVEGTTEKVMGEFKNPPKRHADERAVVANEAGIKPAQGNLSEVVSSRPPNIIKGRFGDGPEGKSKPAQILIATGETGCATGVALKPAQPTHGHVSKPARGSLALAMSEPAQEFVSEPAHRAMTPPDPADDRDASDGAAERAVAAFFSMLDKGEGLRTCGGVLFTFYNRKRAVYGWPELTATAFGRLLRKAVEAAGGRKIKSGGQIYIGVGVPSAWQNGE
jgi:hypothetical protein